MPSPSNCASSWATFGWMCETNHAHCIFEPYDVAAAADVAEVEGAAADLAAAAARCGRNGDLLTLRRFAYRGSRLRAPPFCGTRNGCYLYRMLIIIALLLGTSGGPRSAAAAAAAAAAPAEDRCCVPERLSIQWRLLCARP